MVAINIDISRDKYGCNKYGCPYKYILGSPGFGKDKIVLVRVADVSTTVLPFSC